jgi:adenylate cyclase
MSAIVNKMLSKIRKIFFGVSRDEMIMGQVLLKKKILTKSQLHNALNLQKEKLDRLGQPVLLGRIIVDLGYASEDSIVRAINEHYHLSIESLSDSIRELVDQKRGSFWERLPAARLPIWLQLSLVTIAIIVVTIFLLNLVILNRQKEQLYEQTVQIGLVSLNYFANEARIPILEDDLVALATLAKNATAAESLSYGLILDTNKTIKAHTDLDQIGTSFGKFINMEKETRLGDVIHFNYTLPDGGRILNLSRPILFKDKILGEAHVGVSIDFIEDTIQRERRTVVTITIFVVVFGILIAVFLGFRFSRPISKLVLATREIGEGHYNYRVHMKRNDELGTLAAAFNHMAQELLEKSLVQESFGKYVGAEVLDMILAHPERHWLKGLRREATTLLADIRGFTSYSDQREPEEVIDELNGFFEIANRVMLRHGGFIDKFIGDGLLAVFGVPVYRENHVERAVRAAIDLQDELQKSTNSSHALLSAVGVSIETGVVVSGNIGSQVKMEYTVIGNSVNVASRLNKLAKGGDIIVSRAIYEIVRGSIPVEPLPLQTLKGIANQIEAYRILRGKEVNYETFKK